MFFAVLPPTVSEPDLCLFLQVVIPAAMVLGGVFALGIGLSLKSQFQKPATGGEALVGQEGDARSVVTRRGGSVFVAGSHWSAVAGMGTEIPAGRRVKVTAVAGLVLTVVAVEEDPGGS
ncbi:MAG: NfeD family protein [Lentisphaeria bacterium]|jgi:membrane-bound serine protease (ClpP class)